MTRRRTLLLGIGVLGILLARWAATQERPPQRVIRADAAAAPVEARPAQRVAPSRAIALPVPIYEDAPREVARVSDAPAVLEPAHVAAQLEARARAASLDPGATEALRRELARALSSQPHTTLAEVACSAALCRVAMVHDDLDAQRELAPAVAGLPALGAGAFYDYVEDAAPPRTILYVVAEGQDIRELLAMP